jgi:hypothetical protein
MFKFVCLVCDKDGVINVCVWLYSNDVPVIRIQLKV